MNHSKITIQLSQQEYQQLLAALEDLPYKKVNHLINLIKNSKQKEEQPEHQQIDSTPKNNFNNNKTFQVGDRIRARWLQGSAWYTGKIRDAKNGQYFIKYDDGDEEWTTAEFIELIKAGVAKENTSGSFKVGDRVQARWQGGNAWFDGTIEEIDGDKIFIKYDDGDEEWTTADFIIIDN